MPWARHSSRSMTDPSAPFTEAPALAQLWHNSVSVQPRSLPYQRSCLRENLQVRGLVGRSWRAGSGGTSTSDTGGPLTCGCVHGASVVRTLSADREVVGLESARAASTVPTAARADSSASGHRCPSVFSIVMALACRANSCGSMLCASSPASRWRLIHCSRASVDEHALVPWRERERDAGRPGDVGPVHERSRVRMMRVVRLYGSLAGYAVCRVALPASDGAGRTNDQQPHGLSSP